MADVQGNALPIEGAIAHDSAVAENPVLMGGEARTTTTTAVADGDAVRLQADDQGRLVVIQNSPRDLVLTDRVVLTSTSETTLIAAVSAEFHDLTFMVLSNESATEVRVDIRDDTGATPVLSVDLAADGGGAVLTFNTPWPQGAVNDNWTAELSAGVSSVYISTQTVTRV